MSALAQTTTALIGVVVGAAATFSLGALGDRWRSKRERRHGWEDRRVAAYTEFAASIKESMSIMFRVAAGRGLDDQPDPISYDEAMPVLADAFMRREGAFELVLLIGSDAIADAARGWAQRVYHMRAALNDSALDRDSWTELVRITNEMRAEFHQLARRDIALINSEL